MPSYRLLTIEKMSSLSQAWIDRRKELEEIPQTNGIMANIESAHKGLAQTIGASPPLNQQIRELTVKILSKDNRHDNFIRLGYSHFGTMIAYAASSDNVEKETEYQNTRKFIYEKGLGGTVLPYDEQEGAAIRLEGRLDKVLRDKLSKMIVQIETEQLSMLSIIEEQIALAKEIRALDKQKRELEGLPDDTVKPIDLRRARLSWLEAVRALETNLRLAVNAKNTTAEKASNLLKELHEAEAEAYKEYTERKQQEANQAAKELSDEKKSDLAD
jgi:hypothetical protein